MHLVRFLARETEEPENGELHGEMILSPEERSLYRQCDSSPRASRQRSFSTSLEAKECPCI